MTVKTGIVMLNMGGPKDLDQVGPFLYNLFMDREIMRLPFHAFMGPFIARRRTPKVRQRYHQIGGGSPILRWTEEQGAAMCAWLDQLAPETAPHRAYTAFRYVPPRAADALQAMQRDGVQRAIAFTQYPQWSCSTTGTSLNDLWRAARELGLENAFEWSVIDRWGMHPGFIDAMAATVHEGLAQLEADARDETLLLFSAHSLPLEVIERGDPYPQEVGASVQAVIDRLDLPNPYLLAYQSQVGPVRWLGPSTDSVLEQAARQGRTHVLVIPIAFTSDHIETLHEIDIEFAEVAEHAGIHHFRRSPALNGSPVFKRALADIVWKHLHSGQRSTSQYALRCPGCTNPKECRTIL